MCSIKQPLPLVVLFLEELQLLMSMSIFTTVRALWVHAENRDAHPHNGPHTYARTHTRLRTLPPPPPHTHTHTHTQDVFLMIRREKLTIFLDATEETTVLQLKKKLEPIVKQSPDHIGLYNQRTDAKESLPDQKTLGDCGYKSGNSKAQDPAPMGMVFWTGEGWGGVTSIVGGCTCASFSAPGHRSMGFLLFHYIYFLIPFFFFFFCQVTSLRIQLSLLIPAHLNYQM